MTTDRTAIRRRLAVGRTAHGPPWSARKPRHRSIVAPLATSFAASMAATVAVGVGVAIARAERERRAARRRTAAERQFALLPGELPVPGLRRIALGQLDLAIDLLGADGVPDAKSVHEIRKALKRLRALVRVLRHELGEEAFSRENAALRDVGRHLSGARDAEVMVSTLDRLMQRHPRRLGRRGGVKRLHEALEAERTSTEAAALDARTRAQALNDLRAIRHRVADWNLDGPSGVEGLEGDLTRLYRQGRTRMRRAQRSKGERGRAMHEWRKRVKDLRYAAEMLEREDPAAGKRRRRRARREPGAAFIHQVASRADRLGEDLGEEHDLAMLAERIGHRGGGRKESDAQTAKMGRRSRRALLKAIARRRRSLRSRTLRSGARLYRRRPKRFVRRLRRAYERALFSRR